MTSRDNPREWVAGSDDQAFYFDWLIRNGKEPRLSVKKIVGSREHVPLLNGHTPFSGALHRMVEQIKQAEARS